MEGYKLQIILLNNVLSVQLYFLVKMNKVLNFYGLKIKYKFFISHKQLYVLEPKKSVKYYKHDFFFFIDIRSSNSDKIHTSEGHEEHWTLIVIQLSGYIYFHTFLFSLYNCNFNFSHQRNNEQQMAQHIMEPTKH